LNQRTPSRNSFAPTPIWSSASTSWRSATQSKRNP
jgi:hypothetical protein